MPFGLVVHLVFKGSHGAVDVTALDHESNALAGLSSIRRSDEKVRGGKVVPLLVTPPVDVDRGRGGIPIPPVVLGRHLEQIGSLPLDVKKQREADLRQ